MSPRDGLIVTLPAGTEEAAATNAVRAKAEWARRALARVGDRPARIAAGPEGLLPDRVDLSAFGEKWDVDYRTTAAGSVRVSERGTMLLVSGVVGDSAACLDAMCRWRDRVAKERLPALALDRAQELGVHPSRVAARNQRTRWGSCSAAGAISLNSDLIFLPEHLVDHVIVHELAHLVHPNHSERFHTLVEHWRPGSQDSRRQLKEGWRYVPAWAMA